MAAARLDIPSIVVIGGYQRSGTYAGCSVDIDTVYESVGAIESGEMTVEQLGELADQAITGARACARVWHREHHARAWPRRWA